MTISFARYLVSSNHIEIPKDVLLKKLKKEVKEINDHYELKKNRITNWWNYSTSVIVEFFTRVDGHKVICSNHVTLYSDGAGGIKFIQNTFSRIINDLHFHNTSGYGGNLYTKGFGILGYVRKGSIKYNTIFGNDWYWYGTNKYTIKRYFGNSKTYYSEANKYEQEVYRNLFNIKIFWVKKITPIMETASKEGWLKHLMFNGDWNQKKPLAAFGKFWTSGEKEEFSKWIEMLKKMKTAYDHRTWKDYKALSIRRGLDDFYNPNFKKIHDEWNQEIAAAKDEEFKKIQDEYKKVFRKKEISLKLRKAKNKKELYSLSEELSICVGYSDYKVKDILVGTLNDKYKVCIEYVKGNIQEIRGHNNLEVPKRIENKFIEMIKERRNYAKI